MDILHLNIGIDVSKDTLDYGYLKETGKAVTGKAANSITGYKKLIATLDKIAPRESWRITLEATSAYHRAFVLFMNEQGVRILVQNPKQARDLARGLGILRKNDETDAVVLALCAKMAWREPELIAEGVRFELQEISRRIDSLTTRRAGEKKRLLKPGLSSVVICSLHRQIGLLDDEILFMEEEWLKLLGTTPELKTAYSNVQTIDGCGKITARKVVSELLVSPRTRTTAQCVAYAGLAPHEQTSGTSLRRKSTTLSSGNKILRTALYMGAISAIRSDTVCRELYLRLVAKGKPKKLAIVAVMAKLMRRIAAVVNRGTPWVRA